MKNLLLWMIMVTSSAMANGDTLECEYNFGKSLTIETLEKTYLKDTGGMKIYVHNTQSPSELSDYVQLYNEEYKITYALVCNKESK